MKNRVGLQNSGGWRIRNLTPVLADGDDEDVDTHAFVMRVFQRYLPQVEFLDDEIYEAFYGEGRTVLSFPLGTR